MIKKILKILAWILLAFVLLAIVGGTFFYFSKTGPENAAKKKMLDKAAILKIDGNEFRDLNRNGELDPYEDLRQPIDARVADLLSQMTIEEKAGMMIYPFHPMGENGEVVSPMNMMAMVTPYNGIINQHINHFALMNADSPENMAKWSNKMQEIAEGSRLGIPVSIATDPRHSGRDEQAAASVYTEAFSQWCDQIGLAAIGDSSLVADFGRIAAKEYRSVGIHSALHPMIDLATEPRWARWQNTFGEDAAMSAKLAAAYIYGFQGDSLGSHSVSCMTKHFAGGGPQADGWDAHFKYGKDQVYPGKNFDYHLIPFQAAIKAGTAQMMPYYGVPVGQTSEDVGFTFNKEIITDLLRNKMGYDGIVCSDWFVIEGFEYFGYTFMEAKDHGVEHLSIPEKYQKAIDAGTDQFGGEINPDPIAELVKSGKLAKSRLDESITRLLKLKFELGLFENPYVDIENAKTTCASPESIEKGYQSQLKSTVLLKNDNNLLPLKKGTKVFLQNMDAAVVGKYATVVDSLADAEIVLMKLQIPYEPRTGILENIFHQGRLSFTEEELKPMLEIMQKKPTIVSIYLERAAIIPEISKNAGGILGHFNASQEALTDIIFGDFNPTGKLPCELPSSEAAAAKQMEDMPYDSENPLFPYGHGLSYSVQEE